MRSSYGALQPLRVSLGITREASRRRGIVCLTGALAAAVVLLVALAGPLSFRSSLLDAVSAIGNDAPSSIATYQPTITGIPYGYDPISGGPLSLLSSLSLSLTCSLKIALIPKKKRSLLSFSTAQARRSSCPSRVRMRLARCPLKPLVQ